MEMIGEMPDRCGADVTADAGGGASDPAGEARIRRLDVRNLMGNDRELILLHRNSEYRLRLTSNGKLILTK